MNTQTFDNSAITELAGFPEIASTWVAANLGKFDLVDVRQPNELEGPLGHVESVVNVPMDDFIKTAGDRDPDRPLVLICRSGRRSGIAAQAAVRAGVKEVVSVEGGMIAWNHDVLGKEDIHAAEKAANAETLREAVFTYNGVPEVSGQWVSEHFGRFRLIDVRGPAELVGPLGRVIQAENEPLQTLVESVADWDKEAPLVIMCRSGGRSAMATNSLLAAGFKNVASMEGGMMGWGASGLPVVHA